MEDGERREGGTHGRMAADDQQTIVVALPNKDLGVIAARDLKKNEMLFYSIVE